MWAYPTPKNWKIKNKNSLAMKDNSCCISFQQTIISVHLAFTTSTSSVLTKLKSFIIIHNIGICGNKCTFLPTFNPRCFRIRWVPSWWRIQRRHGYWMPSLLQSLLLRSVFSNSRSWRQEKVRRKEDFPLVKEYQIRKQTWCAQSHGLQWGLPMSAVGAGKWCC